MSTAAPTNWVSASGQKKPICEGRVPSCPPCQQAKCISGAWECIAVKCPTGQTCDPATGKCKGGTTDKCKGVTCPRGQTCDPATGRCKGGGGGCTEPKPCNEAVCRDGRWDKSACPGTPVGSCRCTNQTCVDCGSNDGKTCMSSTDCEGSGGGGKGSCCPGHATHAGCQEWCTYKGYGSAFLTNGECCCSNKPPDAPCGGGGGGDPGDIDLSGCMATISGKCPDGYEKVGDRCCPGMFVLKGPYQTYGGTYKGGEWIPSHNQAIKYAGQGYLEDATKMIEPLRGTYGAGDVGANYESLLRDLGGAERGVTLPDIQNLLSSPLALELLGEGGDITGMTNLMSGKISDLINRPKGFTPEEEALLLERMRSQIGEEYRQASEGTAADLAARGLSESGLGAALTAEARRGAAGQMGNAARDVAIENLLRKTTEQQAALGIGQQFLTGQQQYLTEKQKTDLQRQIAEREDVYQRQSFLSEQQQRELQVRLANKENVYRGLDIRRAVLGDESDWVMANRQLDLQRQEHNKELKMRGAEFDLQREVAHQEMLLNSARFGLSAEELEASINTERMKIAQDSTAQILQYIIALLSAAGGA